jgi:hypothetical protein
VPGLAVPVQPLLQASSQPFGMFRDYWKYDWMLPVYRYEGLEPLLAALAEKVIAPAELKAKAFRRNGSQLEQQPTIAIVPRRARYRESTRVIPNVLWDFLTFVQGALEAMLVFIRIMRSAQGIRDAFDWWLSFLRQTRC